MSTATLQIEKKKTLVPQLRFQDFDGEWKQILLEDFAKRGSGHTPNKSHPEYYNGDINWISLTDSKKLDNGYIEYTNTKITQLGLDNSSAVLHPAGSVLLSRDAGVGKSAVMKHSMAVSQHFIVWSPKENFSSNWFLYNVLQILKPEFERIAIGNTIKTIGLPYFKKLKITAPSFPEQQKIATFLSAVDEKIQQLSRKKELLEQYKKGVIQQLFSGKLRFKDENGKDYADWEEKKLGTAGRFISGTGFTEKEQGGSNGIPFLKVSDMNLANNKIQITESNNYVSEEQVKRMKYKVITSDSIIFAKVGAAIFLERKRIAKNFLIDNNMMAFVPLGNISFYYHLLNNIRLSKFAQVGALPSYNSSDLAIIKILIPCQNEQQKIADFLSSIDRKIESTTQQITQTQSFKKGLLQQMFV